MKAPISRISSRLSDLPLKWLGWAGLGLFLLVLVFTYRLWFPALNAAADGFAETSPGGKAKSEATRGDEHAGHDHAGHQESESIELSRQARANIGLETGEIKLESHPRYINVPALVTERPGETHHKIAAPLTGVVTAVHIVGGETVESGELLFNLRLTHEDLVKAQTEFLTTLGQLDVEHRELARLKKITTGAVAQKVVLQRQYEVDKLEAVLKAQRNSLYLHGLSDEQVESIVKDRDLIREMKVRVPFLHADESLHEENEARRQPLKSISTEGSPSPGQDEHHVESKPFVVSQLNVQTGEAVQTGQTLCVLSDYSELYIEGRAFEQDADEINEAANQHRRVVAFPEQRNQGSPTGVEQLEIEYVANQVERESRALHFYVNLPNEVVRKSARGNHKFVTWRFKPGQRMQLRVPVEEWQDVIVVPVDAVAQEGPETFVFVENGDYFDRQPVHIKYRDQYDAVIANDGSVFPGDIIALNGAHQLQMAIKNKSGGAVDPHAGHHH